MSSKTPSFDAEIPDADRTDQETDIAPPRFAEDTGEGVEDEVSSRTVHEADDGDVVDQAVEIEFDDADDDPSEE